MSKTIIKILERTKEFVTDDSDAMWTCYETGAHFRNEIDTWIERIKAGDSSVFPEIEFAFAPACSFQDHSLQNGWTKEYHKLAEDFDHAVARVKTKHWLLRLFCFCK